MSVLVVMEQSRGAWHKMSWETLAGALQLGWCITAQSLIVARLHHLTAPAKPQTACGCKRVAQCHGQPASGSLARVSHTVRHYN